jgi:RNA-directed DNA polymerase
MFDLVARRTLAPAIANAFLAGPWDAPAMARRARGALAGRAPWLPRVADEVLAAYHRPPLDAHRELARYVELVLDELPDPRRRKRRPPPVVRRHSIAVAVMGPERWPVPRLDTVADLAGWLDLTVSHLDWYADVRGLERHVADEALRQYRCAWVPRRTGPPRLLEAPKPRLKAVQRRVLHEILDAIPAHPAAHGFTRGRSAVTNAAAHTRQRVVVSLDLQNFFAAVTAARVYGIFRAAGYPEAVAHLLAGLCTTTTRPAVRAAAPDPLRRALATPHLPQGAPTSPALANLVAYGLDVRLAGLARACGATYTRYADDLTFSGPLHAAAPRLIATVRVIARESGFAVNESKTRYGTQAGRQRVTGVVVNAGTNAPREEYDALRALLHDARLHGPAAANRAAVPDLRAHALGRIAWVGALNPARGAKLHAQFAAVDWT